MNDNMIIQNQDILSDLTDNFKELYLLDYQNDVISILKSEIFKRTNTNLETFINDLQKSLVNKLITDEIKEFLTNINQLNSNIYKEFVLEFNIYKWYKLVIKNSSNKIMIILIDITTTIEILNDNMIKTRYDAQIDNLTSILGCATRIAYLDILQIDPLYNQVIKYFTDDKVRSKIISNNIDEFLNKWVAMASPNERKLIIDKFHHVINKGSIGSTHNFTFSSNRNNSKFCWFNVDIYIDGTIDHKKLNIFITDITKELDEKIRLKDLAERDELTDLFNRSKFEDMVKNDYLSLTSAAVYFFDVNNLKEINDQYGHDKGDELLRLVASSIRSISNRKSKSFRYGGDEFVMVSENVSEEDAKKTIPMWKKRIEDLSREYNFDISVAYGYAFSLNPNVQALVSEADKKMYNCKNNMKNGNTI